MDYAAQFVRDRKTCGGEAVFRGTRVLLRTVLADVADGADLREILVHRERPSTSPRGHASRGPVSASARSYSAREAVRVNDFETAAAGI